MNKILFTSAIGCLGLLWCLGCETGEDLEDGLDEDLSGRATSVGLYQAETFTAQSGCKIATNNAGYTGAGFVDYGGNGTWIEFNNVNAAQAGSYTLKFRYATAANGRPCAILINGTNVGNVAFSGTGSWIKWETASLTKSLKAGKNTIRILANTSIGGPNLDSMELLSNIVDNCPNDPNKTEPGACGCGKPEGSCGTEENVAEGKGTRQSSTAYSGVSSRAVDGNTDGKWGSNSVTHTENTAAPWWIVDLGKAHRLSGVTLSNRTDCCSDRLSNFHVDYLDASGKVIVKKDYPGVAGATADIDLSASGVHSVRVQLYGANFLSLAEVEVWGEIETGGSSLCVEAAENKTAALACPTGQTIASVSFASYGLPTGACPGGFATGTCHAASSLDKVKASCLNKPSCSVAASNGVFGDPCSGKAKKLAVVYTCGGGGPIDNCPSDPKKTEPGKCGCGVPEGTCDSFSGSFTLGLLPDVQKVTMNDTGAQWLNKVGSFLIDSQQEYNLVGVASVGDLVQVADLPGTRNQTRWDRVLNFAHSLKTKDIHFMPGCGNHDGCQSNYGHPDDYSAQFSSLIRQGGPDGSPAAYVLKRDNPLFRGNYSTTNPANGVENAYYRIEEGGRSFIVLSLRFGDSSETQTLRNVWNNWAKKVLEDNSDASAIIVTHWLTNSAAWLDSANPAICAHDNVFMVLEGHSHGDRYRKIVDCGGGHKIERHQFSFSHGTEPLNEAATRLYTFDLGAGKVCFKTRHVFQNKWLTEQAGCSPTCTSKCNCDQFCIDLPPSP